MIIVEDKAYELIRKLFFGEIGIPEMKIRLKKLLKSSSNREYTVIATAIRITNNLEKDHIKDFLSNLRQFILYTKEIPIPENLFHKLEKYLSEFRIESYKDEASSNRYLYSKLVMPTWFEEGLSISELYRRESRNKSIRVLGDFHLHSMTGFEEYTSSAQKIMIDTVLNMPEGTTLLSCMATGQGKSLIGLLPQYYYGRGLTVIVVPTISLAIDQADSAKEYFEEKKVVAYHGGLSHIEKCETRRLINENELSILYTSPEAIMNSDLKTILLKAAERKKLETLIIDEAHIVHDWGQQFRTEFQFLGVYRKKLLDSSQGSLRTILLSATYTDEAVDVLKRLFSEQGKYIEVRGDSLRPEIQYYSKKVKNNNEKIDKFKEILPLLPKPMILYVTLPKTAIELKEKLESWGYFNLETFTGELNSEKREEIISRWNDNKIDIMIATSAFGMGVDKKDVRTVLHLSIPESLNRFYQEVGRGGRDGLPSISLIITNLSQDIKDSKSLGNKALSVDKMMGRWNSLINMNLGSIAGNKYWVDTNIKPEYMEFDYIAGEQNRSWNEYVLMQMQRIGLINIIDMGEEINTSKYLVKVINESYINNQKLLRGYLTGHRKLYIENYEEDIERLKELIESDGEFCISEKLQDTYNLASLSCGGCKSCREKKIKAYTSKNLTVYESGLELIKQIKSERAIGKREKIVKVDDNYSDSSLKKIIEVLIVNEINTILIPDDFKIDLNKLNINITKEPYFNILRNVEYEDKRSEYILAGNIAMVYSNDDQEYNKKLIKKSKKNKKNEDKNYVHISKEFEVYPEYRLNDRIDGDIIRVGGKDEGI